MSADIYGLNHSILAGEENVLNKIRGEEWETIHVENTFRQLPHFSIKLEEKDTVCIFSKLQMEKFKTIPSLRLPILLREIQTKVFGCIEIKSVLLYKQNALLKKYDFETY
jgi:hypothetical protein